MSKYTVTHRCNHSEIVTLFGPHKDRERRIEWLSSLPCPACCSIDRITSAAAIHELQEAAGLPRLVGSEKQVAWAVTRRQEMLSGWRKIEKQLTDVALSDEPSAKLAEELLFAADEWMAAPLAEASAKVWIDGPGTWTESALQRALYHIRLEIADKAKAIVPDSMPISSADKREIINLAIEARKTALQERRDLAAQQKQESIQRADLEAADKQRQAAEQQQKLWAKKDELALAIRDAVGPDNCPIEVTVWRKDTEKRVYLDRGRVKICYYATGSKYHRPGSLDGKLGDLDALKAACEIASKEWNSLRITVGRDGKANV